MKILTLITRIPIPPRDGGAVVILDTLRELRKAGVDVDVFALNTKRHHAAATELGEYCNELVVYPVDTDVTWYGALRNVFFPKRQAWPPHHAMSYWTERFVNDEAVSMLIDMYHKHGPYDIICAESLFAVEMAARLSTTLDPDTRPPVMYRSHNVEHLLQERMSHEASRSFLERIYRAFLAGRTCRNEKVAVRTVDAVATISDDDADIYRAYAPGQFVEAVAPGVYTPPDELVASARRQPDTIALLGSLEWAPNVKGAVWFVKEVMPHILHKCPNVVLHIAGRRPVKEVLDLHNGTSVIVHGEVADAHTFRMNYAVNVVSVQSAGGIRIKILDCLGMGCPVVSTSPGASGLPPAAWDYLLLADTAVDFADACVKLLADAQLASDIALRGRQYVIANFGWEARIRHLISFLEKVSKREKVS